MTADQPVPAAQYLRMSTEHQQYSLEHQSTGIQKYAESHGFEVVHTYSDAAKSGVALRHRTGLRQMLQDVVAGTASYRAILVYDVSRWGRFQDTDESAHYEFLCKSAAVPVHYCAETFANDGSLPSLIMKALKRTMAGEYSRELGVKVLDGQRRLASMGFKQGGRPGYGLRRLLVSPDGTPKQPLAEGERKSIATDRVILVPGPSHEVQVVREIYRMLVADEVTVHGIATELNRNGVPYTKYSKWDYQAVYGILTHPKYVGCHVYGRTSCRLYTPSIKLPKSEWILTHGAFEPVLDKTTFLQAQRILTGRTSNKSDEELLENLRTLLGREGRLSLKLIKNAADAPSPSTYRLRFGSLRRAYQLIGYGRPVQFGPIDLRRRTQALREELVANLAAMFPNDVSVLRRGGRWRSRLHLRKGPIVSILLARSVKAWQETVRWQIDPVRHERKCVTLLARLDNENEAFFDFHVMPGIERLTRFHIRLKDSWLQGGLRLETLSSFCHVVREVRSAAILRGSTPSGA
ncbi:MAG: recombinase family protein [Candidatus Sulfotelmatobacter sp.]|jgi:DNA invertase Pin-like site-specific DNA recombinase